MEFEFGWSVGRVPKKVVFPDGHVEITQYMRDGLIMFMSGASAGYVRISPDEDHTAKFIVHSTFEDKKNTLDSYMNKQPR